MFVCSIFRSFGTKQAEYVCFFFACFGTALRAGGAPPLYPALSRAISVRPSNARRGLRPLHTSPRGCARYEARTPFTGDKSIEVLRALSTAE